MVRKRETHNFDSELENVITIGFLRVLHSATMLSTIIFSPMVVLPFLVAAVLFLLVCYIVSGPRKQNLVPPGPYPLPIIGNLHQLPPLYQHTKFTEWAAQYGE